MITHIPRYIFNFFFFILLQVFILNKIELSGQLNPFLYILFLITLPFETPGWLLMVLGAITGLTVDVFLNTAGMHMAACILLTYVRPHILRGIAPRDSYEPGTLPLPSHYGFSWFIKYALILTIIHHFFYFLIDSFGTKGFITTLTTTILSSIFTLVIMLVTMLFTYTKKRRT